MKRRKTNEVERKRAHSLMRIVLSNVGVVVATGLLYLAAGGLGALSFYWLAETTDQAIQVSQLFMAAMFGFWSASLYTLRQRQRNILHDT